MNVQSRPIVGLVPPFTRETAILKIRVEVFDNLRSGIMKDRSQFYKDLAVMFYGANRPGARVSQGTLHGEDDQIVPVKDSAKKSARPIKGAKEIYYPGVPHGLTATHQDQVNADPLAFIREPARKPSRV